MLGVENSVTTPLDDFNPVVQSFHESTAVSLQEIVGYFIFARNQGCHETIETANLATFDAGHPAIEQSLRLRSSDIQIEDLRELVSKHASLFQ